MRFLLSIFCPKLSNFKGYLKGLSLVCQMSNSFAQLWHWHPGYILGNNGNIFLQTFFFYFKFFYWKIKILPFNFFFNLLVLLSALVERFSVCRMRDFWSQNQVLQKFKSWISPTWPYRKNYREALWKCIKYCPM